MRLLDIFETHYESEEPGDILGVLKDQHREVKDLLEEIEDTSETAHVTRGKLLMELKKKLVSHAHAEQEILYTAMVAIPELAFDGYEGYQEHALVDFLFKKLDHLGPAKGDEWGATVKVLKEVVEHHIEDEEGEFFPKVEEEFSPEEREDLGRRFLQRQSVLLARMKSPHGPKKRSHSRAS